MWFCQAIPAGTESARIFSVIVGFVNFATGVTPMLLNPQGDPAMKTHRSSGFT